MSENLTQNSRFTQRTEKAINSIEDILDDLGIEWVQRHPERINIICPVHESQDLSSSCIYINSGKYKCWSRRCDEEIGSSFIHLIKWCLEKELGHPITMIDVDKYLDGQKFNIKKREIKKYERSDEIKLMDPTKYPSVSIPSKYYIEKRNLTPEVLTKFGIGDTNQFPYNDRSVVPIRTPSGGLMGFSARSMHDKCPKCEYYHSKYQGCISKDYEYAHMFNKWYHSKGMEKSRTLYPVDMIKGPINKIAIVEGPSCVWRLDEFAIPAVALLGGTFSPDQAKLLTNLGVKKVFLLLDKDEAGNEFKAKFIKNYKNTFQIFLANLPAKDVTEMSDEQITETIIKKWNEI